MATSWQSNLLITGAPITADSDPDDSEPSAARVFMADQSTAAVLVQLLDGTSATATVWTYDGTEWAVVSGATGSVGTSVPLMLAVTPGQLTFVALTSVTGSPTACVVLSGAATPAVLAALLTRASLTLGSATIHADVDEVEDKLDTLHTDLATTIHTDLATTLAGKLDTLHTDVGTTIHTDLATTIHGDLATTLHADIATTLKNAVDAVLTGLKSGTQSTAITPSDVEFTACRAITVATFGTVVGKLANDTESRTFTLTPGLWDLSFKLITAASTATGIVAIY